MEAISLDELAKKLGTVTLIDVREAEEYAAGHVPSAYNIPLSALTGQVDNVAIGSYIICQSGRRSARACQLLEAAGIPVINVLEGTSGWTGELVKE